MATFRLTDIARQLIFERGAFARRHPHPWILWTPPRRGNEPFIESTDAASRDPVDLEHQSAPLAIEVVKDPKANPFALGITVGHAGNNDLVLHHRSVSRFHAYFQARGRGWCVVDAESRNGTFLEGQRIPPNKPAALGAKARLEFGSVEVLFFSPERFLEHLEELASR